VWDWLATPDGVRMEHALIILLLALAGYFARSAREQSGKNARMLNGHLEAHLMADDAREEAPPP